MSQTTYSNNSTYSTLTSTSTIDATSIPDTKLAREAMEILREYSTELLFNHSLRVYLFGAEQGRQLRLRFDPELLFVSAAFHDMGLVKKYSSATERFEVDGANAVRQFLTAYNVPEEWVQTAWEAIALHTTPGVTQYMRPEVALLFTGVGLDVLGEGFESFPAELREQIVREYPRENFKEGIVKAFFGGFAQKPGSTWGTVKADVCERFIAGYKSPNFCDLIAGSPFPDSVRG
jgi:HD domain